MADFIAEVAISTAILLASLGLVAYLIRRWISEGIAHHFESLLERNKAALDLEKQKGLLLVEKRGSIYPEMLELAYRLRIGLREISNEEGWKTGPDPALLGRIKEMREQVYQLTDRLYRHRAFIDESTFEDLHGYKRVLQDCVVLLNRLTRPDLQFNRDANEEKSYVESVTALADAYAKVNRLYNVIVEKVKTHMESSLQA